MTTYGFVYLFLLLAAIAVVLPNPSQAQQRTVVGINIILKPIQTIHVVPASPGTAKRIASFGTSMYGVTVDHMTNDSLAVLKKLAMAKVIPGNRPDAAAQPIVRRESRPPATSERRLVVYSIRVH